MSIIQAVICTALIGIIVGLILTLVATYAGNRPVLQDIIIKIAITICTVGAIVLVVAGLVGIWSEVE